MHGARVAPATSAERGRGAREAATALSAADAIVLREPGVAAMVLGADCPLLLLLDPAAPAAALVHAGWRGIVAGVVEAALAALAPRDPSRIEARLAPHAGPCCYEVGEELAPRFPPAAVRRRPGGARSTLDLAAAITARLPLHPKPLPPGPACTICDERFFSHRRTRTPHRQALLAAFVVP